MNLHETYGSWKTRSKCHFKISFETKQCRHQNKNLTNLFEHIIMLKKNWKKNWPVYFEISQTKRANSERKLQQLRVKRNFRNSLCSIQLIEQSSKVKINSSKLNSQVEEATTHSTLTQSNFNAIIKLMSQISLHKSFKCRLYAFPQCGK